MLVLERCIKKSIYSEKILPEVPERPRALLKPGHSTTSHNNEWLARLVLPLSLFIAFIELASFRRRDSNALFLEHITPLIIDPTGGKPHCTPFFPDPLNDPVRCSRGCAVGRSLAAREAEGCTEPLLSAPWVVELRELS
jgi:hypothetical protein